MELMNKYQGSDFQNRVSLTALNSESALTHLGSLDLLLLPGTFLSH